MKQLLLLLTCLLTVTAVQADDAILQVWFADGQVMSINLNDNPRTTYNDGNLVIQTDKNSVTYPLEQVRRYTYVTSTGIESSPSISAAFTNDGETLTFTGLKPHTPISLYNVAGVLLKTFESNDRSKTVISASHLPVGVYVVKVNGGTYKIMKR